MSRALVLLLGFLLLSSIRAQDPAPVAAPRDRQVTVTLNDGKVVQGKVVAMDLASLQVESGEFVVTIPAADIRTCHFDDGTGTMHEVTLPAQPPVPEAKAPAKAADPAPRARLPLQDPVAGELDPASIPHDLRRSRWRSRLADLDERYPWLVPAAPMQWLSIGLLLFACLSLVVHLSTSVVGAEANAAGRCMALAAWYMVTTLLQVALVPTLQLSTFVMLIANPALALFWLRSLFDLTRGAAVIAFAVQLGFVLLGYGVLELVTALLGSINGGHA